MYISSIQNRQECTRLMKLHAVMRSYKQSTLVCSFLSFKYTFGMDNSVLFIEVSSIQRCPYI